MHCSKDNINNRKYIVHFIRLLLPPKSPVLPNLGGYPYVQDLNIFIVPIKRLRKKKETKKKEGQINIGGCVHTHTCTYYINNKLYLKLLFTRTVIYTHAHACKTLTTKNSAGLFE